MTAQLLNAAPSNREVPELITETVMEVSRLDARTGADMTPGDRLADVATAFSGSVLFVALHVAWFATWIAVNTIPGLPHFDAFPFGFLTLMVGLEAIFLATFVLISQNRQAVMADRRARVDLQVNVIAEREVTKLIELVTEIHDHLSIDRPHDPALDQMRTDTYVSDLADAVEGVEAQVNPESAQGPNSAADTEA